MNDIQSHLIQSTDGPLFCFEGIKLASHFSRGDGEHCVTTLYGTIDGRYMHVADTWTPTSPREIDPPTDAVRFVTIACDDDELHDFLDADDPLLRLMSSHGGAVAYAHQDLKRDS